MYAFFVIIFIYLFGNDDDDDGYDKDMMMMIAVELNMTGMVMTGIMKAKISQNGVESYYNDDDDDGNKNGYYVSIKIDRLMVMVGKTCLPC